MRHQSHYILDPPGSAGHTVYSPTTSFGNNPRAPVEAIVLEDGENQQSIRRASTYTDDEPFS